MVETIKFSEFASGGDLSNDKTTVGLDATLTINTRFNNPWTFLAPGTTGDRPAPAAAMYYRLRFNTTLESYEFYDPTSVTWVQLEDSGDIQDLIDRLAAHTAGNGASMIGLQNQGSVVNKFVQDMANATILAQTDNGTLVNGVFLSAQSTGFLSVTTTTGALASRIHTGTVNQIEIANGNGSSNPVYSLSSTLNAPGTFTIQGTIALDEIIDDDTMATATDSNVSTSESIVAYIASVIDAGVGLNWNSVAGTTQLCEANNGYINDNAAQTTYTLPLNASAGKIVAIQGKGAGGWILTANTGQTIQIGNTATSTAGTITSNNQFDAIEVVCITANTTWSMRNSVSSGFTVA